MISVMREIIKSTGKAYTEKAPHDFAELREIIAILRDPEEGCSWDSAQSLDSLKSCLSNETDEVLEAIDRKDMENLCEELGDLLLQVLLQSRIAEENGFFSFDDVVQVLSEKMIRRHPYVFTDLKVHSEEERLDLWKKIKEREKAEKAEKAKKAEEAHTRHRA